MFETLLVVGTLFFAAACRTSASTPLRKLGALAVLAATFMAGYFIGGQSVIGGCIATLLWIMLPLLDLLTRIRGMRLPLDKKLRHRYPPTPDTFPHLREFTRDVENNGFDHVEDSGWEWDGMDQFVRLFYDEDSKQQATINLSRQSHVAFAYLSVSSRAEDGRIWTTWNYPFGYSMKMVPEQQVNRVRAVGSFAEMLENHKQFLTEQGIDPTKIPQADPEDLGELLERDMRDQVDHNLDRGLIKLSGEGTFRYSWRGLLYLWGQSLKDMVRLS